MATEQTLSGAYFDTPARAERLQLLLHLVRNAGEVIYLRGPAGAGKTRFVQRLFDILGDETATVWVPASSDCDVPAIVVDQLGLAPAEISPWPDAVLNAISDRDLLVIVDDADLLGLAAVDSLAQLHARGGRLLLIGQGGLAQTSGNWDVQFVDLPPFDAQQTVAFLRSQAGDQAARVTDDLAAGLHRAANGAPGLLLDALNGVLANRRAVPAVPRSAVGSGDPETHKRPVWHWLAIGLGLAVLVAVLQFQDQINALFVSDAGRGQDAQETVVAEAVAPVTRPAPESVRPVPPVEPVPPLEPVAPVEPVPPVEPVREPVASEGLREEAVSALMPEINLPELSREPTASGTKAVEPTPSPPPAGPADTDTGADEDPLDAVMRDAIAAARKQKAVAPVAAEPVTTPEAGAVAKTPPVEAPAAAVDKSSDDEPEAPAVAQAAPVAAPQRPEPASTTPHAPVEPHQAAPVPAPVVEPRPVKTASSRAPVASSEWLKSRAPAHYTLQLVGARDRAAVEKFVRDYRIDQPYAIFERDLKGKPWYSLVAGDYPNRDAAIAARGRLPKRLERSGVWPRTFGSIQKLNQ